MKKILLLGLLLMAMPVMATEFDCVQVGNTTWECDMPFNFTALEEHFTGNCTAMIEQKTSNLTSDLVDCKEELGNFSGKLLTCEERRNELFTENIDKVEEISSIRESRATCTKELELVSNDLIECKKNEGYCDPMYWVSMTTHNTLLNEATNNMYLYCIASAVVGVILWEKWLKPKKSGAEAEERTGGKIQDMRLD